MKIVTVTPINKGIFKDHLTYFSALDVTIGAIVTVPIRNRTIDALVLDVHNASTRKSEIKSSDFTLKKITEIKTVGLFLPEFLIACQKTADHFATTLGQTIKAVIPQSIIENLSHSKKIDISDSKQTEEDHDNTVKQNKFILQDDDNERLSYYKSWIREAFAKKQSVLICLPTTALATKFSKSFGAGILDYTIPIHSELSKKTLLQNWNKAITLPHPLLIITTGSFLSLPRPDIKTIIIEMESHGSYKSITRPLIDFRILAENLATEMNAKFILGDLVLRAETVFKSERGEYSHLSSQKYRSVSSATQIILDSRNRDSGDKNIYALGDNLRDLITTITINREKMVIYSGKKGLSPSTICNDCGQVVHCHQCKSPLVLHKNPNQKKYIYLCHKCGQSEEVADKCPNCNSWRLSLFGVGLEKIEEELKILLPDVPIFRLDADIIKPKQRSEITKKFYETKGAAILVGTEILLSQLDEKVSNIVVAVVDGIFSIPDFQISEKVLNTILRLRQYANKRFIIQTRNPEEKVFHYATEGNLIDFYREEIEERMKFGYPPFKVLIKISREGKPQEVTNDMEILATHLADYNPLIFPAFISEIKGKYRMHALIKIPANSWVDTRLLSKLKELNPNFIIDIEPESIL